MSTVRLTIWLLLCGIEIGCVAAAADDLVLADFEQASYQGWQVTGEAFGEQPASGSLPGQQEVTGYRGRQLVNTFRGGDASKGSATSKLFTIERSHLAFLIGGGAIPEQLSVDLIIGDQVVRSATGTESEQLTWTSWDVKEYLGTPARIRITDEATGGWGHISVDQIIQTDTPPSPFDLQQPLAEYRASPTYLDERLRPQFHFSPEIYWMNDPNGLVYFQGEYHLFYQYNPAGNSWGHMSWGHAVSSDLVHWEHLPLAIPETGGVMAFSGCCVIDKANTTGFADSEFSPMVAVYTAHTRSKQAQNLAYSNDKGRTWSVYENNPVLDLNKRDFRDPKVFWHAPSARWIMVVSLANEKIIQFYASTDLKHWTLLSDFGPAGVVNKPNWECPDLFPLAVDNEPGKTLWVLEADMGSGSIAGGSGGEYFVGQFDGERFTTQQAAQWVDFGRDFYAPVSWSNIPESDGRRIWIGWMNNWETALIPTDPWRGCMSIPRQLGLRRLAFNREEPATYVLVQQPVREMEQLRDAPIELDTGEATWPPRQVVSVEQLRDRTFELQATLVPGKARSVGFRFRTGESEFTEVGYDRDYLSVYVDRTQAGASDFNPNFAGRHHAPARLVDDKVQLRVFVDRSTIEVFINGGEAVISDRIFPTGEMTKIEVFAGDQTAKIEDAVVYPLKSIWHHPK